MCEILLIKYVCWISKVFFVELQNEIAKKHMIYDNAIFLMNKDLLKSVYQILIKIHWHFYKRIYMVWNHFHTIIHMKFHIKIVYRHHYKINYSS